MILEKQKEANVLRTGTDDDSIKMSLDLDSAQILMQMLSKNLYSDAIGSSIRETVSNALDSHRRVGVDEPIIVSYRRNKDDNYEFCVEDFGMGLDDVDVKGIISKYGKSTKRDSTTELGMMGLGFKSPLAYSSSFYFICRKNGMERKYMMYEGEDTNTIDLLYEAPTKERNGVKVIIPVKYSDRNSFIPKMKEQLAYFENVYFDVDFGYSSPITNDFKIHRADNYQFSELSSDKNMHICLDNVYYPIDFDKLGIPRLDVAIGLKFSLTDGLFPTPNREALRYTQEAKTTILSKIKAVADDFMNLYNQSVLDSDEALVIIHHYKATSKYVIVDEVKFHVTDLLKYSGVTPSTPKLKGINLLDMKQISGISDYILDEYECKFTMRSNRISTVTGGYWNVKASLSWIEDGNVYVYSDVFSGNKKSYLKEQHTTYETVRFIKKVNPFPLYQCDKKREYSSYMSILELKKHPKSEWRTRINEFNVLIEMILKNTKDLDALVIPQKWLDARKKTRMVINSSGVAVRKTKLQGDISCKKAEQLERYVDGQNCKFVPTMYNLEKFHQNPCLTIYTLHEDKMKLDELYNIGKKHKLNYITTSERESKNLEEAELHNLITYEEFMKGDNKPFKRLVTAYLIKNLIDEQSSVFEYRHKLKSISTSLYTKLDELVNYRKSYFDVANRDMYEAMLVIAEKHNYFDTSIYDVYKDVKGFLEKSPFIHTVARTLGYNRNDDMVEVLRDVMKYYKIRIDYTNYNIKLDDDVKSVVTEEELEEIINN